MLYREEQCQIALHSAIKSGNTELVMSMLNAIGSQPPELQAKYLSYADEEGYTALMLATTVYYNEDIADKIIDMIKYLPIEQQNQVLSCKKEDKTAFMLIEDYTNLLQEQMRYSGRNCLEQKIQKSR